MSKTSNHLSALETINTFQLLVVDDNVTDNDRTNELDSGYNNKSFNILQQSFSPDYTGPIIVLVEILIWKTGILLKLQNCSQNNFSGIIKIKPACSKKIKITFDNIVNGNLFKL